MTESKNIADDASSRTLLDGVVRGEADAERQIVDQYLHRLLQLTRSRLSPHLTRRFDSEDVVQSAYRSFFAHARNDQYVLRRAGDLWRLLAAIALNKLHRNVAYHSAQKRDIDRDTNAMHVVLPQVDPTPDEVVSATEQLQLLMSTLSESHRLALQMRLAGHTVADISAELDRSQRTVRRVLQEIRDRMTAMLTSNASTE